ncbi:MAG: YmfQ family protein [Candidatus Omnitrophica bacterium]|nr:YmfQ family protein [Candidatus Omnitrophota bacterium]
MQFSRDVKIEAYWPNVVSKMREMGQIANTENEEFDLLWVAIGNFISDLFIKTATENGVSRWETILGIVPASGATLNERKQLILTQVNIRTPYTWRYVKKIIADFFGITTFEMDYEIDFQTLTVSGNGATESQISQITEILKWILPAQIKLVVKIV